MAKRVTINKVNDHIKDLGYGLFHGAGYFYFYCLDERPDLMCLDEESVYVYHLNDYTIEEWRGMLEDKIKVTKDNSYDDTDIDLSKPITLRYTRFLK